MKIGDLVQAFAPHHSTVESIGIIIGFNEKGEGGKGFVHVLVSDGTVLMYNSFDIKVIRSLQKKKK
tara:strand:- start:257 stop:454 length:198 start_codon:yes stop_codon:yes gene_type:complete